MAFEIKCPSCGYRNSVARSGITLDIDPVDGQLLAEDKEIEDSKFGSCINCNFRGKLHRFVTSNH